MSGTIAYCEFEAESRAVIQYRIPAIVELLKDRDSLVRARCMETLEKLSEHGKSYLDFKELLFTIKSKLSSELKFNTAFLLSLGSCRTAVRLFNRGVWKRWGSYQSTVRIT